MHTVDFQYSDIAATICGSDSTGQHGKINEHTANVCGSDPVNVVAQVVEVFEENQRKRKE